MIAFDIDIQYVGVLCKRGHDYNSTGKSLRYRANNTCVVCAAGHSRKHSKTDKAKARQKAYRTTEKRKVYIMKYNQSEKGKATRKAYATQTLKNVVGYHLKHINRRTHLKKVLINTVKVVKVNCAQNEVIIKGATELIQTEFIISPMRSKTGLIVLVTDVRIVVVNIKA